MRDRVVKVVVALLVTLLLLPGVSYALTDKQKVLVGLKGVLVVVEDVAPHVERLGLRKDPIKKDTELRLRKAGVKVSDTRRMGKNAGDACSLCENWRFC